MGMRRWVIVLSAVVVFASALLTQRTGKAQGPENGAVTGEIIFHIDMPEVDKIKVTRDADVCGAQQESQEFVVSAANKGLKNVVVTLIGVPDTQPDSVSSISLDQKGCAYHPHVQVTARGAGLTITNSDPTFHNVHAYQVHSESKRPTLFNVAQPAGSDAASQRFTLDEAGVVEFNCDVHPWMKAYVVVHENRFFSITDESGRYQIDGVPPGDYTLRVWHEGLGEFDQPVTITAGETLTMDFPIEENE